MRRWLARKLFPEAFEKAERYDWMQNEMAMCQRWLAHDAPAIGAFIERLWTTEKWHFHRGLPLLPQPKWRVDIAAFRDQLRKEFPKPIQPLKGE